MTQQEAFLQAILENPAEDASRLVYADWLDDNGQPERAQFIRVQVQLGRLSEDDPQHKELRRLETQLMRGRKKAWRLELPTLRGVKWGDFTRGFVESVQFSSAYWFSQHIRRVTTTAPIQCIHFRRATQPRAMKAVGTTPYLARVTELHLQDQGLNSERLAELLASPYLGSLTTLNLRYNDLGTAGAEMLAQATTLPALKHLDVGENDIGDQGARALISAPHWKTLQSLCLMHNRLTSRAKAVLRQHFGDRLRL